MRGRPFYEEPEFHRYLLSRDRRELFPADRLFAQIKWTGVKEYLDFGMGNGYFLPAFYRHAEPDCNVWGAESQEVLIDYTLGVKVKEGWERFLPFYVERTEHPLLPDWIPDMDLILCSCVLSTFADPALAIRGVGRSLKNEGRMIVFDWEKIDAPSGPDLTQKISRDRMQFFIEDAGYVVRQTLRTNKYIYALELEKGEEARKEKERYSYVGATI